MAPRQRNLLILLGVIVVGAAAFFLLTMGGEEPAEEAAPTQPSSSPTVVEPAPEQPAKPPRAFTFFGGRDPFVPLVVPAAGGGGATTAAAGTAPAGTTPPTEPVQPVPQGAEQQEAGGVTMGGRTVTLVDIVDDDTAQVQVDGRTFTVSEGDAFAQNFELVSVSGNCARFLFGDESFTLCQGEAPK